MTNLDVLPYVPPVQENTDELPLPQLRDGAINIIESGVEREGYPRFRTGQPSGRLFMTKEEVLEATQFEEAYELSDGTLTKIARIELPSGHDTISASRETFLSNPDNVANLIYPPERDITTMPTSSPGMQLISDEVFRRYLDSGYRVFDQHNRPLPGSFKRVMQLLSLRTRGDWGEPLGVPVGNGTFASPGYHPAGDAFPLMPLDDGGLALLAYGRPRSTQSYEVWAPPGGFGSREDIDNGRYSSVETIMRLCRTKTDFDIMESPIKRVHVELALSSPTTINSGLISENYMVAVPRNQRIEREVLHEIPMGEDVVGPHWLSVSALVKLNTELRRGSVRRDYDGSQPDQIFWSTHMRGLIAAVNHWRQWFS